MKEFRTWLCPICKQWRGNDISYNDIVSKYKEDLEVQGFNIQSSLRQSIDQHLQECQYKTFGYNLLEEERRNLQIEEWLKQPKPRKPIDGGKVYDNLAILQKFFGYEQNWIKEEQQ